MVTFLLFDKIFTDKIFTVTLSSYADCRTATMGRCPAYYFDQASGDTHPIFAPPLIFAPPCGAWEFPFASKESASGAGEFGDSYATVAPQQLILSLFRATLLSGPGMIS
jgi:hypothetical protein